MSVVDYNLHIAVSILMLITSPRPLLPTITDTYYTTLPMLCCTYTTYIVYNASKYAVRGFTEAARHDLVGTPLRVTLISPGMVGNTEFSNVRLRDDEKAAQGERRGFILFPKKCNASQ
jgi:3-hydroxy acid dehydrogenase/malonic semialdehyde reductase